MFFSLCIAKTFNLEIGTFKISQLRLKLKVTLMTKPKCLKMLKKMLRVPSLD